MPALTPRLLRAYRATTYSLDGAEFRIGRRDAALDRLLDALGARRAGLVTADNPFSIRMPRLLNARAMRRLVAAARRWPLRPGRGGHGRWSEAMLLVAADPRVVARLGRRFRQHAVVALRRGAPPRLVVLSPPARQP